MFTYYVTECDTNCLGTCSAKGTDKCDNDNCADGTYYDATDFICSSMAFMFLAALSFNLISM